MRAWMPMVLGVALVCTGCAVFKQAKADYDTGKTTALAAGELSPRSAAEGLVEPIKPFLPTPLQPLAGFAVTALAIFGTWKRGKRIRLEQPVSTNPIVGSWGQKLGLESVVQNVVTATRGAFEVGPEGSGVRRAWKVGVSVILALVAGVLVIPGAQTVVLSHPEITGTLTLLTSLIAGLEKEFSKVLPVAEAPKT